MPGNHATGTLGILSSSELDRDLAGLQGTYGWATQSGTVTFTSGLTFAVAAVAAGDYTVNSVAGALYAGGSVVLSTQDPTNPRVDIIVITSAGAVSAVAGTPKALTTTSGPVPTAPTASQLEIARIYVPASGTALTSANITDRRVSLARTSISNYKSATQTFTTNTTFADVTGAIGATFSFAIAANEVWEVLYHIPLAFTGTGGVKLQLTGPAAATSVAIMGTHTINRANGAATDVQTVQYATQAAAFSSNFGSANSENGATTSNVYNNQGGSSTPQIVVEARARIINGANAGTVTLQAAQNSSNADSILGLGTFMRADRLK